MYKKILFLVFIIGVSFTMIFIANANAAAPDLIIEDVKLEPATIPVSIPYHSNDYAQLTFTVSNWGDADAINMPNKLYPVVYPGDSSNFHSQPADEQGCHITAVLPPNSGCGMSYTIMPGKSGSQQLVIEISGGIIEQESNRNNNKYVLAFTASPNVIVNKSLDDLETQASNVFVGSEVVLAKYQFLAYGEDITIKKLQLLISNSSDPAVTISSANDEVSKIKLYDGPALSTTGTQIGNPDGYEVGVDGVVRIDNLDWIISGIQRYLVVKGSINTVANGADIGSPVYSHLMSSGFEAVGVTTGMTDTSIGSSSVRGNQKIVVDGNSSSKPDLNVSDIYNNNGKLSIKISNIGTGVASSNSGYLYIWIDDQLQWAYSFNKIPDQSFLSVGETTIVQPQTFSGQHKIKAVIDQTGAIAESNENNNALEKTLSFDTAYSISLISPNGGENLSVGVPNTIKWSSSGVSSVMFNLTNDQGSVLVTNLSANINMNTKEATWTPSSDVLKAFPEGKYKIMAQGCQYKKFSDCGYDKLVWDFSNAYFTISDKDAVPTIQTVISTTLNQNTPMTPILPASIQDGDLVRGPDGIKVYIVNAHGYKRHIFNPAIFNMYGHFKWDKIKSVDKKTLDSLKTSDFYRADGDPKVFYLKEIDEKHSLAQKRWMDILGDKFSQLGYKWEQIFIINTKERDYYQEGTALSEQELQQGAVQ